MNNLKNNMLMEEVSDKVMEKRIKAFTQLGCDLMNDEFVPSADITEKLRKIEENHLKAEAKSNSTINVNAVKTYPVSINHLITTKFLSDYQSRDQFIGGLKTKLRSAGSHRSGFKLRNKYRLLNDTVVVTRADKNIPFEEAYNLRILCSEEMALIILSYLHLFNNHAGFNALVKMFNVAYKTQGLIALTKIVTKCCRSCSLETLNPNHIVPKGRIPLPERPMSTWWVDHMVFGGELTIKGKKVDSALNFLDGYSGLLISHLVPNQKVETTMECFRKTFASMGVPDTIVTDNHKALNLNEKLRRYLSSQGVKNIVTTSPYHSQANKCERIHKTLRRAIRLAGETFCRNPIEIYHQIVLMVNSRPLVVSDHPLIRKLIAKSDRYVSPFDLHYGRPMTFNPMNELLNSKFGEDEEERRKFQEKWNKLLVDLDEEKRKDLEIENENFHRPPGYEIGDIVYLVNNARHKESLRFIRNLFVIVDNKWKKFRLRPLFGNPNGNEFQAHADDLKAYNFSHLLEILPPELKALMGQNVSPDKLKEKVQKDPKYIPDDLLPKNVFEEIGLRNRLTPRSVGSIPAILSSDNSFISDEFRFQGENWSDVESTPSAKGFKRVLPRDMHQGSERGSKKKEELEERREEGRVSGGPGPRNVSSPKSIFESTRMSGKSRRSSGSKPDLSPIPRSARMGDIGVEDLGSDREEDENVVSENPDDAPSRKKGLSPTKWFKKAVESVKGLDKTAWWSPKGGRKDTSREMVDQQEQASFSEESQIEDVEDVPDVVVYESPKKGTQKRKVRFDQDTPVVFKERVTRYGRKTKVPARYQE